LRFTLRVDDVGLNPKCPDKRDCGLKLAQRFHGVMGGLPFLAAVIPSCVDDEGLAWLQSRPEAMRVALHGFDHAPVEFRGLTTEQCQERIKRAKDALAGLSIKDIVLPFNQYEWPLAEACRLEGIELIWGGGHHTHTDPSFWPTPPAPYPLEHVMFVPAWKPTYAATLWRMSDEVKGLNCVLPGLLDLPGKAVLTLHITWEASFTDTFSGVRWLVDTIGDRLMTIEEYFQNDR
jgi:hypothetical protein